MNKQEKKILMTIIKGSRPRPAVRQRSTRFEDKSKYKRSREKARLRKEYGSPRSW